MSSATLNDLLRAAVRRWPALPAIIAGSGTWTFQQLDGEVDRRSAALRQLGIGHGQRVALIASANADALATLAAIGRLGASLVPIDPTNPPERLRHILDDAACRIAVVDASLFPLPIDARCPIISLHELAQTVSTNGTGALRSDPDHEAYVIYTSGSTGMPKGVRVAQSAIAQHVRLAADYFGLTSGDRVLQFASLGFDVAFEEIWSTWAAGAALVLKPERLLDTQRLVDLVDTHQISVLQLPTAYWRTVITELSSIDREPLRVVRTVIIGNEAASLRDFHAFQRSPLGNAELINAYGPTECVVTATALRIPAGGTPPDSAGGLPIGRAFPGRTLTILRDDGSPAGNGDVGQLFVGGLLSEGYLNHDDLTAQRFRTIESTEHDKRRMYATGDLVRQLSTGDLEFIGRNDGQVKLRGYRMELDEIDAVLRSLPEVLDAATTLLPRSDAEPLLVAAVVADTGHGSVTDLASQLVEHLPAAMIPTVWGYVERVPLTSSGKVDRSAVATLVADRPPSHSPTAAPVVAAPGAPAAPPPPADQVHTFSDIWREVLGVPTADPGDDFFASGGDSLLAVRFAARARAAGYTLTPAAVLRAGTLARIVAASTSNATARSSQGATSDLRLFPAQHRWLRDGPIPDIDHFVLNALFTVPHDLRHQALLDTAAVLLRQHEVLRSRFDLTHEPPTVHLADSRPEDLVRVIDLGVLPDHDVAPALTKVVTDLQRSLHLGNGPVAQLVHVPLGREPGRLLLVAHHLLLDGWSMSSLVDDVDTALVGAVRHGRATLPPPTASLHEVASAFDAYVHSPLAVEDATRWLEAPWDRVARLPQDGDGLALLPSVKTARSWLTTADSVRLLHSLPRGGPRAADLLTASILIATAEWSGRSVQAMDIYSHSRDEAVGTLDLSRTIGYLQSTFPIVVAVDAPGVDGVMEQVLAPSRLPSRRYSFDALRFLSPRPAERRALSALPPSPLRLNYRSQLDRLERRTSQSLLGNCDEDTGAHRSPRQSERYQLMFEGDVIEGRFVVGVKYSTDHYSPERIDRLVQRSAELLAASVGRLT